MDVFAEYIDSQFLPFDQIRLSLDHSDFGAQMPVAENISEAMVIDNALEAKTTKVTRTSGFYPECESRLGVALLSSFKTIHNRYRRYQIWILTYFVIPYTILP